MRFEVAAVALFSAACLAGGVPGAVYHPSDDSAPLDSLDGPNDGLDGSTPYDNSYGSTDDNPNPGIPYASNANPVYSSAVSWIKNGVGSPSTTGPMIAVNPTSPPGNSMIAANPGSSPTNSMIAANPGSSPTNSMIAVNSGSSPTNSMIAVNPGSSSNNSISSAPTSTSSLSMSTSLTTAMPSMPFPAGNITTSIPGTGVVTLPKSSTTAIAISGTAAATTTASGQSVGSPSSSATSSSATAAGATAGVGGALILGAAGLSFALLGM